MHKIRIKPSGVKLMFGLVGARNEYEIVSLQCPMYSVYRILPRRPIANHPIKNDRIDSMMVLELTVFLSADFVYLMARRGIANSSTEPMMCFKTRHK
jgi:hypothetical protein